MPQPSTSGKRGRPPGTGKNDTDRLLKIAALMSADPALKPTTAIKRIGETDPSTIRRLRDKFHEQQAQLTTAQPGPPMPVAAAAALPVLPPLQFRPAVGPQPAMKQMVAAAPPAAALAIAELAAAAAWQEPPVRADVAVIDFEPLFKPAPVQDPYMVFGKWFGNGIETAAVLFEQQMLFAQSMLKAAPMKAIWRQQIVATEYLLMLSGPGQRISASTPSNNG
jgi:hypothetical protein